MKINKWTAFAIGILLISSLGLAGALTPSGYPFAIKNVTSGKTVAWFDREGNLNITGKLDVNLDLFSGTGTLGMGNITDPTDCSSGYVVKGKTGGSWDCVVDDDVPDDDSEVPDAITVSGGTINLLTNTYSGNLGWGNLTGYNLDTAWTGTLLASGNITACGAGEILKMSGGVWTCAADATGDITDVYVNETGDTMTGNLVMSTGADLVLDSGGGSIIDDQDSSAYIKFDSNGGIEIGLA